MRAALNSQSPRLSSSPCVQGRRCSLRRRRSCQNPPLEAKGSRSHASHTTVSAPCPGVRNSGRISRWNVGSDEAIPGVSTQPGCIAWNTTWSGATRRAHSWLCTTWARLALA